MSTRYAAVFFFFNDTATTEIYTLSLHDALPIWDGLVAADDDVDHAVAGQREVAHAVADGGVAGRERELEHLRAHPPEDRKSTRLNSSHANISYAVFCLKKKI